MSKPIRVQLSRKKGWRMPENTVKVDRATRWGNPFNVHIDGKPFKQRSVELFREQLAENRHYVTHPKGRTPYNNFLDDIRRLLSGKNLACWCHLCPEHATGKPLGVTCTDCEPCHADCLLEISNAA